VVGRGCGFVVEQDRFEYDGWVSVVVSARTQPTERERERVWEGEKETDPEEVEHELFVLKVEEFKIVR